MKVEGHNHNKDLHISVTCTYTLVSRVLVDTGSSLNMFPNRTLSQLQFEGTEMRASALTARAFCGSRREVIGEVDLSISVSPHQFTITFQVMNIHPAYSFLLGRSWIHVVDAVMSTLHQKLKFMVGDKLVIVCGEEDFVICEFPSFQYVEIQKRIVEFPFHYLDFKDDSSASSHQS